MKSYKYEIFTTVIERLITEGIYQYGDKLPSVREIRQKYGISMSTVQQGYEYLVIKGMIKSVSKSGYYVSEQQDISTAPTLIPPVRNAVFKHNLHLTTSLRNTGKRLTEFNVAAPGDLFIPQKLLLRTMQQVIREQGAGILRYYPPNGSAKLRNSIAKRAGRYHTTLNPDELLITDGALQALFIALSSVCQPGDIIAVENPCIFSALEVISVLKLKVIEIPLIQGKEPDFTSLWNTFARVNVRALLVTPNFQNPTGLLFSDEQKRKLLSIALHYGIPLIENDVYGDLNFSKLRPSTIKSFDESGLVMTYSSYSKTLAPGIRVGWLSAGKFFEKAEQIKFALGSSVSPIYQETISKLLDSERYDRHIRSFKLQLAKNARHTVDLLSRYFPEGTQVFMPEGGFSLWVKMPAQTDMNKFYNESEKTGIRFTPGSTFSFSTAYNQFFRLVFADKLSARKEESLKEAGKIAQRSVLPFS